MAFTKKDGINIATRANEYNLHDLLYTITYGHNPSELAKKLLSIVMAIYGEKLTIKDDEGNNVDTEGLADLAAALIRLKSDIKEEFKLHVFPIVLE